jgi:pimeloyl-ACP methyl ester carboxylesterase
MVRVIKTAATLCASLLAAAVLMSGCGSKSSSQSSSATTNVDPVKLLANINTGLQQPLTHSLSGWDWSSFLGNFGSLLTSFRYTLQMQKVTYQSTGADGQIHTMTGLLILPSPVSGAKPSVPILMYQHGTEVYRPFSPSQFLAHQDTPTNYPEVMVAAAIASTGYAVAMVDYEGMGDNTDPQPHVVGATLARQVVDLLKASVGIIGGTTGNSSSPCSWNSQLFLMGYSEGGYVTMTATRELQLNNAAQFTVTASAPLSGPQDLSGTMRGLILSNIPFKAPYFVPMILTSYNYAYGGQTTFFSPGFAMIPPYATVIPPLFDGNSKSDTISEAMGMTFSPVKLITTESTLTQQFVAQLASVTSPVFAILQQNDSYRLPGQLSATWVPTVPVRMIHHLNDELVPFANSQVAFNAFSTAGAKNHVSRGPGVELVANTVAVNLSSDPVQTVHHAAAFPELIDGWNWLNGFKK